MNQASEHNQEATVYVGNLDERVTEALLWELFVQVGAVVHVHIPKDRISMNQQNFGFVEFASAGDAEYAAKVMNMIKLFGKSIRVNKASADKKSLDIGANLFVGNLDPSVDEKMLYDIFGAFGNILQVKLSRETDSGLSRGFAFIHFDDFGASDTALQTMDGQYICNQAVTITYAYKKGGAPGERHGTPAERLLAAQLKSLGPQD